MIFPKPGFDADEQSSKLAKYRLRNIDFFQEYNQKNFVLQIDQERRHNEQRVSKQKSRGFPGLIMKKLRKVEDRKI